MKLLVTGAWTCASEQLNNLKSLGHEVVFMQNEKDELPCNPTEVEGVICNGLFLFHDIDNFTSLRFIQLTSAGLDRVPMDKVNLRGIKIFNARGVYSVPMAEYAVWGVLSLYKNAKTFIKNQLQNQWEKNRKVLELFGKTVLIVGCGNVGLECAKRFKVFGVNTIGIDLEERQDEIVGKVYKIADINLALNKADVVVLTLPLTDLTKGLFNQERFNQMKDGSVLVNIARGQIVEESSLLQALENKLLGAVLDVFEQEPLPEDSPLWQKENVFVTPHNSFVGDGNGERLTEVIIKNLNVVGN